MADGISFTRELCQALGQICSKCSKSNHFAVNFKSHTSTTNLHEDVQTTHNDNLDVVFPTEVLAIKVDNFQLVTIQVDSGNLLHFQVDSEAQCTIIPIQLHQKATKDSNKCYSHKIKYHCICDLILEN